ncbi:hypothetical protein AAVH_09546, partial [Aphelenchoides avenae]
MRELECDFAAYELEPPGDDQSPQFKEHDIAIIQLKEDVPENDTSIRPVCLPPPGSELKNQRTPSNKTYGKASERLMEVKLRMATEKDELYQLYASWCKNKRFFCLLPINATTRQDGARGSRHKAADSYGHRPQPGAVPLRPLLLHRHMRQARMGGHDERDEAD